VTLDSYTLMQLAARYRLRAGFEVLGRIENLLGETYEDVYTYRSPGRAAYAGLRVEL
jgi:vitamin B12 transporter